MDWGNFQGSDQQQEAMELGQKLSLISHCSIHFYGPNLFKCECGVIFPVYFLRGHTWEEIADFHSRERKLALA